MEVVPGNFAGRQRKLQQEQTQYLFPPIFSMPELAPSSQWRGKHGSRSLTSSASSKSSRLSCRPNEISFRFPSSQSAPGSAYHNPPCSSASPHSSPTPLPIPSGVQWGAKCISIPQSIREVEEEREGGASGRGQVKNAASSSRIETGVCEI